MLTVRDFLDDNPQIRGIKGYARLCADLEYYSSRVTAPMANTIILKNLLANEYGSATDVALAKLCRVWLVQSISAQLNINQ